MHTLAAPPTAPTETWLPIPGHPVYYASDRGRIWSSRSARVLRPDYSSRYGRVDLDGRTTKSIHHLVLEAFVGPRPDGMLALHRNDDPHDNIIENLYWGTLSDNQHDAVANGRHYEARRTHCPHGHEYSSENTQIRQNKRSCRTCARERARR